MKTDAKSLRGAAKDRTLHRSMRFIGALLAIGSLVLVRQDFITSTMGTWFLLFSAGLGAITAAASWIPSVSLQVQENRVVQFVSERRE